MTICSKNRHVEAQSDDCSETSSKPDVEEKTIDIHTSEAPITITTVNVDKTIEQMCLHGLAVGGILDLFVVERTINNYSRDREPGKDAIFMDSEAWTHPIPPSTRGTAMMLSTFRMFSHIASAKVMGKPSQDAVLHLILTLTRFPPAVRAFYILMNGKSLSVAEKAVLCQTI